MKNDLLIESLTVQAIYRHYEERKEERRTYLGASALGTECRRALWYGYRWAGRPTFPGRMLRLFDNGHREEERIKEDLRAIGVTVDCEQMEFVFADGHGAGHIDGAVLGIPEAPKTWHLLECKTANKERYNELLKKGPPEIHLVQMQISMGELDLTRALYFVQCKDDDRLHTERIHYDPAVHQAALRKASTIIQAQSLPDRLSNDPSFFKCKMCEWQMMCHTKIVPDINCRTCLHSSPVAGGEWTCGRGLKQPCDQHLFIPSLLWWMTATDGGDTWVKYDEVTNAAVGADVQGPTATSVELQDGSWIPF